MFVGSFLYGTYAISLGILAIDRGKVENVYRGGLDPDIVILI